MENIITTFRERIEEYTSPFMSSFIISWIIINHKYLLICFGTAEAKEKIDLLKDISFSLILKNEYITEIWGYYSFWMPLSIALFYVYGYPFFANKFYSQAMSNKSTKERIKYSKYTKALHSDKQKLQTKIIEKEQIINEQQKLLIELEEQIKKKHQYEIEKTISKYQEERDELRNGYVENEKILLNNHMEEISKINNRHTEEISKINNRHDEEMKNLQKRHKEEIRRLEKQNRNNSLNNLTKDYDHEKYQKAISELYPNKEFLLNNSLDDLLKNYDREKYQKNISELYPNKEFLLNSSLDDLLKNYDREKYQKNKDNSIDDLLKI